MSDPIPTTVPPTDSSAPTPAPVSDFFGWSEDAFNSKDLVVEPEAKPMTNDQWLMTNEGEFSAPVEASKPVVEEERKMPTFEPEVKGMTNDQSFGFAEDKWPITDDQSFGSAEDKWLMTNEGSFSMPNFESSQPSIVPNPIVPPPSEPIVQPEFTMPTFEPEEASPVERLKGWSVESEWHSIPAFEPQIATVSEPTFEPAPEPIVGPSLEPMLEVEPEEASPVEILKSWSVEGEWTSIPEVEPEVQTDNSEEIADNEEEISTPEVEPQEPIANDNWKLEIDLSTKVGNWKLKSDIMTKFDELFQMTKQVAEMKKTTEWFELLGANNDKIHVMYKFFIWDEAYPMVTITKMETDKEADEETSHELSFYLNEQGTALNVNLDEVLLFDELVDLQSDLKKKMQVIDKLNKFIFLLSEESRKLEKEIKEREAEEQEIKKLQDVFRNF